jgi:hypothetical protein
MVEFLGKINEILSLSAKSVLIVCVVCWTLVLIPAGDGTPSPIAQLKAWTWLGAEVSSAWLATLLAWNVADWIIARHRNLQILRTLSPVERERLRMYLKDNTTTLNFRYGAGVPMGLVRKGILYLPSEVSIGGDQFAFNVSPWAWELLKKHPDLVKE